MISAPQAGNNPYLFGRGRVGWTFGTVIMPEAAGVVSVWPEAAATVLGSELVSGMLGPTGGLEVPV